MHMTKSQFNALLDAKSGTKKNKFGAKKTEYKDRVYDSSKEAKRAFELDAMLRAGEILKIEYQPKYEIVVNGQRVANYFADFRVTYSDGHVEVEDTKGFKTPIYKLKKKLVEAIHNIKIVET